jgi:hypothetical protein
MDTLKSAIKKNETTQASRHNLSIIYGGRDIAHTVATANESLWAGQSSFVG